MSGIPYGGFGAYQTQVLPDGTVQVSEGGDWSTPWPTDAEIAVFDGHVARWAPLALENEKRTGVPAPWTLAIIYSESGGDPEKHGPPSDYGIGLMMITAQGLKQGLSDEEVFVPENNIRLGTDFLRTLMTKYGATDVAKAASEFNCGPGNQGGPKANPSAPYGYCEYKIPDTGAYPYISKVVRINNYAAAQMAAIGGSGSSATNLAVMAIFAMLGYLAYDNRKAIGDMLGV
jgi:soluble lytic murein transglycosylase-like protein